MKAYFDTNESLWNEKTRVHLASKFYDNASFLAGRNSLNPIELALLPDIAGKRILHLQCHFGQDSLSLARMGAKVTGLDFSGEAIKAARHFNEQLGLDARFIQGNVYDTRNLIQDTFDLVFASYGAIPWLPDLDAWAELIYQSLEPGGRFVFAEFHPTLYLFNFDNQRVEFSYFNQGEPYEETNDGTYAVPDAPLRHKEYFWSHSLAEVIQPFLERQMQLLDFAEFDYSPYSCFPNMRERAAGEYVFGEVSLPHIFRLMFKK